ncbi:hypothetical protein EJB05_30446 [Eragrostis curvula]|uniref:glutathione transferase n=1 Tax=Eragrostis curvula TaxID=38414 RepID=A0A5J9UBC1_9POAL|nr:hypothetical protein EJB05_30446 [Eragrostis curvula]
MAPVTVFGSAVFANAARVLVCLEEVGIEYEVVEVDYMAKEHKGPEHLSRNFDLWMLMDGPWCGDVSLQPFGQIPALQDGDVMLFESRAISKYVLRKYGKASNVDLLREGNAEEAALVDVWTEVEAHHYFPAIAPIVYECVVFPARLGMQPNQKVVNESLEKLGKVLEIYEARLSKSKYLAGDFFSFADLTHFPYTYYFMKTTHASLLDKFPHVKAWWEDLMSRPSTKKHGAGMFLEP